ncbi:MAG: nucleotidyltransferase family protein [Granulosicoccus sp.]
MTPTDGDTVTRRSQAGRFIVDVLTHKLDTCNLTHLSEELDWHDVLAISGDYLVTPSLFVALRNSGGLESIPADPREALEWIYEANSQRNRQLLRAWAALVQTLDNADVKCLPLKGIALLYCGYCPDNDRVLADIDFLVQGSQLPKALQVLQAAGYRQISNVNDPRSFNSEPEYPILDPDDFRNKVHPVGYQLPAILPPDEEIVFELHYRIGEDDRGIWQYMQPLANKLFEEGGYTLRSDTLDTFLIAHTFYHSHIKDAGHATGTLDLRHILDIERFFAAGADVNRALEHLRKHFVNTKDLAALASFVHVCAEIWPERIKIWRDIDAAELKGVTHFDTLRSRPVRARLARWRLELSRRARFVIVPGWLKSLYGDRNAVVLLFRLVRYGLIKIFHWLKHKL